MEENIKNIEKLIEMIVEKMRQLDGRANYKEVLRPLFNGDNEYSIATVRRMASKGLIKQEDGSLGIYILTEYGWTFEGFSKEHSDKFEKENLDKQEKQSVIDTNKAVQSNIFLSLFLAAISVVFIGLTVWLQYQDKTEQEISKLRLQVKASSQSLGSIVLSLKRLDSSIKSTSNGYLPTKIQ